jgi:hypothetical protein
MTIRTAAVIASRLTQRSLASQFLNLRSRSPNLWNPESDRDSSRRM